MTHKQVPTEVLRQVLDALKKSVPIVVGWNREHSAAIMALQAILDAPSEPDIGPEWKPCKKLPIVVHVREQRKGETHVSTREGITAVEPDDLIMRGVAGEEYPIGRDLFNRTYKMETP
jgi:hypothetical protein